MDQVPSLVATFLEHLKIRFVPPTPAETAEIGELLVRASKEARAQWPGVELPPALFVRHVAERLEEKEGQVRPIPELLAGLSLTELYLTCACLQGLSAAHEAFERDYLAKLPGKLGGSGQRDALLDDVRQITRVDLLVATPESAPRIGQYKGRGLMAWVAVTAGRIKTKLQTAEKPAAGEDWGEIIKDIPSQEGGPEIEAIKRRHQAEFRQALREAASTLSAHERHLFRLQFGGKLSTHDLAKLFRVNQSTISRWLKSARQRVYEETLRRLQARLGLATSDMLSFVAFVKSQLDMSLSQILDDKDSDPEPEDDKDSDPESEDDKDSDPESEDD